MSSLPPKADFTAIQDAVFGMQKSSRRSVPLFILGIASTLLSAGVAGYFIINLSYDLNEARHSLQASRIALASAQAQLSRAKYLLAQGNNAINSQERVQIGKAISSISSSQNELKAASNSISIASNKIVPAQPDTMNSGFNGSWVDEYGTKYLIDNKGKQFAYEVTFLDRVTGRQTMGKANGRASGDAASYTVSDGFGRKFNCSARLTGNALQIFENCTDQIGLETRVILTRL